MEKKRLEVSIEYITKFFRIANYYSLLFIIHLKYAKYKIIKSETISDYSHDIIH